jgi:hypothetical protein
LPDIADGRKRFMQNLPENFFDEILGKLGWSMDDLAKATGYRLETLQKARRGHAEVKLNAKMKAAIERAAELAMERGKIAETPSGYRVTVLEAGKPAREIMTPPPTEESTIAELTELLRDFQNASAFGRKSLIKRIAELVSELESSVTGQRSPTKEITSQTQTGGRGNLMAGGSIIHPSA